MLTRILTTCIVLALLFGAASCSLHDGGSDGGRADAGDAAVGTDSGTSDGGAADSGATDAGGDAGSGDGGTAAKTLGMNDVTILVPLPTPTVSPVLLKATDLADDGTPLVPSSLFNQVIFDPAVSQNDIFATLDQFQITAVRFDACDRIAPGTCPAGSDGRLRVVFQPVDAPTSQARDVGLHAFYLIPAAQMPAVVASLRQLSQLQGEPITSPLKVSPALTLNAAGTYAAQLRQLLVNHSGTNRLTRLTFLAQPDINAAILWVMRGVEKQGANFVPISIPALDAGMERAVLVNRASYDVTPLADAPAGIAMAWQEQAFQGATAQQQAQALSVLADIENPLVNTPATIQCFTCHSATVLLAQRSADAGIDPSSIPGQYSSTYDLSIDAGLSATAPVFVRGLGWRGTVPLISQRAANETAQALSELEARFPAP